MAVPRVQFTVQWLMLAAAVLAILCFAGAMRARSRTFESLATFHAREEKHCRFVLEVRANDVEDALKEERECRKRAEQPTTAMDYTCRADAENAHENARQYRLQFDALAELRDYHHELSEKYKRAATHPWEQVDADDPKPVYPQFGGPVPQSSRCSGAF